MSHTETEHQFDVDQVSTADVEPSRVAPSIVDPSLVEAVPVLEFPDPPLTGDPEVDEAINAVALAVHGPLEDQLAAYEAAHRTLQDRLADVEG